MPLMIRSAVTTKAIEHVPTRDPQPSVAFYGTRGGCQVPIGVNTQLDGDTLTLGIDSVDGKS